MEQRTAQHIRRRLSQRGYEIFRTREPYPDEQTLHHHDYYEIELIWGGTLHYRIGGRDYHLTAGDILLVGPDELHQLAAGEEQFVCERLILWIDGNYLEQFRTFGFDAAECFDTSRERHTNCLRFEDDTVLLLGSLMERCIRELDSGDFGARMMADTSMIQAVILINRLCRSAARSEHPDRSGTLVSGVLDYINDHYDEELTLDGLANRFFISKYHLSREFGRLVGTSVHRYIIQKRLAVAKQLLGEGRPSSAVYQHCGFGDYSNFYRAFKSEYGISPKEYAAMLREDAARNAERTRERSWLVRDADVE